MLCLVARNLTNPDAWYTMWNNLSWTRNSSLTQAKQIRKAESKNPFKQCWFEKKTYDTEQLFIIDMHTLNKLIDFPATQRHLGAGYQEHRTVWLDASTGEEKMR